MRLGLSLLRRGLRPLRAVKEAMSGALYNDVVQPRVIQLLDIVALATDLPQYNLRRGQVGTVVEILANGTAYEVEFSDREGRTYESVGLRPNQIVVGHFEPVEENNSLVPELT